MLDGNDGWGLKIGVVCGAKSWASVSLALSILSRVVAGVRRFLALCVRRSDSVDAAVARATFDGGCQRLLTDAATEFLRRNGCLAVALDEELFSLLLGASVSWVVVRCNGDVDLLLAREARDSRVRFVVREQMHVR